MIDEKFCQDCGQRHQCRQVYEKMGSTQGPSVLRKVLLAFLLPVMIFIAALTVFESTLIKTNHQNGIGIAVSFLLALVITLLSILAIKIFEKQFGKKNRFNIP